MRQPVDQTERVRLNVTAKRGIVMAVPIVVQPVLDEKYSPGKRMLFEAAPVTELTSPNGL